MIQTLDGFNPVSGVGYRRGRMDRASTVEPEYSKAPEGAITLRKTQRAFSTSMIISGIRCVIAYVLLPFAPLSSAWRRALGPASGSPSEQSPSERTSTRYVASGG